MGPTWGPPGPCRPQMGPMLAHEPCYRGNYYQLENTSTDLINHASPGVGDSNASQNMLISGIVRYFTCHSKT